MYQKVKGQLLYTLSAEEMLYVASLILKHRKDLAFPLEVETGLEAVLDGSKPAYLTFGQDYIMIKQQFTAQGWEYLTNLAKEDRGWSMLFAQGKNYKNPRLEFTVMWFAPQKNIVTIETLLDTFEESYCISPILSKVSHTDRGTILDALNQALVGVLLGYPIEDIARFVSERVTRLNANRLINAMFGTAASEGMLEQDFKACAPQI